MSMTVKSVRVSPLFAFGAARECGLEKGDMWFPPDSVRMSRKTVVYNKIEE